MMRRGPSLLTLLLGSIYFISLHNALATVHVDASAVASSRKRRSMPTPTRTATTAVSTLPRGGKKKSAAWLDGVKNGLASAMSAACVKTTLQPIDAVKTIQQYHQQKAGSAAAAATASTEATTTAALSVWAACREIMSRPGGFWNFYAGLGVTVFGAMPGVALYFGVYSYCKQVLGTRTKWNKTAVVGLSAAVGNSVASFSRVPYEVLKQKLQTGAYTGPWQAVKAAASEPGGVWRLLFPPGGVAIQMIRDVPYAICTLLLYESLQAAYHQRQQKKEGSSSSTEKKAASEKNFMDFVLGGAAGGIGSWVTNPMDVVKTRLQTDSDLYQGSVMKCAQSIWDEGGAPAFLRGSVPRLMHKVPANAFFFLFYEIFRKLLRVDDSLAS